MCIVHFYLKRRGLRPQLGHHFELRINFCKRRRALALRCIGSFALAMHIGHEALRLSGGQCCPRARFDLGQATLE